MTNTYKIIQNEYICIYLTSFPSPLDLNSNRMFPNDLTKLGPDKRGVSSFIAYTMTWSAKMFPFDHSL